MSQCRDAVAACADHAVGLAQHHLHVGGHHGLNGAGKPRPVGREHQAGREGVQHMAQLVEVLADQRIRRRDSAKRHARVHGAQGQFGVVQAVLAQDHQRPLGRQASVQQGLANAPGRVQGLCKAQVAPVVTERRVALRIQRGVGLALGPVKQAIGHALGIRQQVLLAAQVAVAAGVAQHAARDAEWKISVDGRGSGTWGHGLDCTLTLGPLPSKKARTRALASGADWASAASMDSVKKPWSAGCSAMRGRPWISA